MAKKNDLPEPINHPLITHIIANCCQSGERLAGNYQTTSIRFVFDWADLHWKEHNDELRHIPNVQYYKLKQWKDIGRILNGRDSLTHALLHMQVTDKREHIPFVAKLIVKYGIESVKLLDIEKKTLIF